MKTQISYFNRPSRIVCCSEIYFTSRNTELSLSPSFLHSLFYGCSFFFSDSFQLFLKQSAEFGSCHFMPRTIIVTETDVSHCFLPVRYSLSRSSYLLLTADIALSAWSEWTDRIASKLDCRPSSIIASAISLGYFVSSGVKSMMV